MLCVFNEFWHIHARIHSWWLIHFYFIFFGRFCHRESVKWNWQDFFQFNVRWMLRICLVIFNKEKYFASSLSFSTLIHLNDDCYPYYVTHIDGVMVVSLQNVIYLFTNQHSMQNDHMLEFHTWKQSKWNICARNRNELWRKINKRISNECEKSLSDGKESCVRRESNVMPAQKKTSSREIPLQYWTGEMSPLRRHRRCWA